MNDTFLDFAALTLSKALKGMAVIILMGGLSAFLGLCLGIGYAVFKWTQK